VLLRREKKPACAGHEDFMEIIKHASHDGLRYTLLAQTQDEIDFLGALDLRGTVAAVKRVLEPKESMPKLVIGMEVHLGCASAAQARLIQA
jgi:hypothetical protein